MFGVRHEINQEFPEFQAEITRLKHSDPDFNRLLTAYDHTDKIIYGIEMQQVPVTDEHMLELKRQRLQLKDRLYQRLRAQYAG